MKKWTTTLALMLAMPALPVAAEEPIPAQPPMLYSAETLQAAKKKISENREAFGITSIATRIKENAIVVTAASWDAEQKNALCTLAGIENILFIAEDGGISAEEETTYTLTLQSPYATINGQITQALSAMPFCEDGIYYLPLSAMLALSGYPADVDIHVQTMSAQIGKTSLFLDGTAKRFSCNGVAHPLLVAPLFAAGHCYIAYNDWKDFVEIAYPDADTISFLWHAEEWESILQTLPTKNIYTFTTGSAVYLKNGSEQQMPAPMYLSGENCMIPLRTIAESMGDAVHISWDAEKKAALVNCAGKVYTFHYPTNTLAIGADAFVLPAALALHDGRLYVPVIDCLAIQYYLGNHMDTFDIYQIDTDTVSVRM